MFSGCSGAYRVRFVGLEPSRRAGLFRYWSEPNFENPTVGFSFRVSLGTLKIVTTFLARFGSDPRESGSSGLCVVSGFDLSAVHFVSSCLPVILLFIYRT